jgi:hypothetical protein
MYVCMSISVPECIYALAQDESGVCVLKILTYVVSTVIFQFTYYSETSIHRFRGGSEKETMDPGKQ